MISLLLPVYIIDEELLEITKKFFEHLELNTLREDYQLIIVDNGSNFGSELLKEKADIYIRKDYPMGYARAVNCAVSLADHDILVVANNDIFVTPEWLPQMLEDYENFGPGILSPFEYIVQPGIYKDQHWYSLFMTDKKTWQTIGYFDETLNYRFHDQDYSIRMKKAGFEVMRTGNVIISGHNSATYSKMGRNEDPEEASMMIERHGFAHFSTWLQHEKE